jgi:predicted Zn-dependent protease
MAPPDASIAYGYSTYLAATGRFEEALAVCEDAFTREPLSPMLTEALSRMLHHLGRLDEAEAVCLNHLRHVPDSDAGIVALMEVFLQHGNVEKAAEYLAQQRALRDIHPAQAAFHELRIAGASNDATRFETAFQRREPFTEHASFRRLRARLTLPAIDPRRMA